MVKNHWLFLPGPPAAAAVCSASEQNPTMREVQKAARSDTRSMQYFKKKYTLLSTKRAQLLCKKINTENHQPKEKEE